MDDSCQSSPTATNRTQSTLELCEGLRRELKPIGALENLLVAEMARRTAKMEWWSAAADAVCQTAATSLENLAAPDQDSTDRSVMLLAAAASCDAVDRAERTSSMQSRAFYRALQMLLVVQQRRAELGDSTLAAPAKNPFLTEGDCLDYLVNRQTANYNCRKCGAHRARFITSRRCLECSSCGSQSGLRTATVMADSPLPLVTWFAAIRIIVDEPAMAISGLQQRMGLARPATVRKIAAKIRAALVAEDRSDLLAGLDHFLGLPASSAPVNKKAQNQKVSARRHVKEVANRFAPLSNAE